VASGTAQNKSQTMGYPVEIFTTSPPDSCICPICHDVLKDPICFKEYCGHTFCDECAQKHLDKDKDEDIEQKSCPTCRKHVTGTVPNFFARETIGALEVKCPTQIDHGENDSNKRARGNEGEVVPASDGCGWVGKCESLHDHEKVCQFKLVTCEIEGCDHQCRRKDMASHLSDDIICHMKLMRESADKKVESVKLSITADYEKKVESMNKEIKALKKKVSELEAKQSQVSVQIKVEGCGIPEMNGIYKQHGMFDGKPHFIKNGRWNGRDAEFNIYWGGIRTWWFGGEFWQLIVVLKYKFSLHSYIKDCSSLHRFNR
jgi:hypothetical protein